MDAKQGKEAVDRSALEGADIILLHTRCVCEREREGERERNLAKVFTQRAPPKARRDWTHTSRAPGEARKSCAGEKNEASSCSEETGRAG